MKSFFKTSLARATAYFTVSTILFCIFVMLNNSNAESIVLEPIRVLFILPFCLFFAIANTLVGCKNIDGAVRWIFHAVLTISGAFIFLILPADLESGSGNFMGGALITFIYIVGILFYLLINKRVKSAIREDRKLTEKDKKQSK